MLSVKWWTCAFVIWRPPSFRKSGADIKSGIGTRISAVRSWVSNVGQEEIWLEDDSNRWNNKETLILARALTKPSSPKDRHRKSWTKKRRNLSNNSVRKSRFQFVYEILTRSDLIMTITFWLGVAVSRRIANRNWCMRNWLPEFCRVPWISLCSRWMTNGMISNRRRADRLL